MTDTRLIKNVSTKRYRRYQYRVTNTLGKNSLKIALKKEAKKVKTAEANTKIKPKKSLDDDKV